MKFVCLALGLFPRLRARWGSLKRSPLPPRGNGTFPLPPPPPGDAMQQGLLTMTWIGIHGRETRVTQYMTEECNRLYIYRPISVKFLSLLFPCFLHHYWLILSLSLKNVFIYLFNLLVVLRLRGIKISANTISFLLKNATNPCRQHVLYGLLTNLQLPRHTFFSVIITC